MILSTCTFDFCLFKNILIRLLAFQEVKELDNGFESRKRTPLNEERGMCPQMERSLVRVNTISKLSDLSPFLA